MSRPTTFRLSLPGLPLRPSLRESPAEAYEGLGLLPASCLVCHGRVWSIEHARRQEAVVDVVTAGPDLHLSIVPHSCRGTNACEAST